MDITTSNNDYYFKIIVICLFLLYICVKEPKNQQQPKFPNKNQKSQNKRAKEKLFYKKSIIQKKNIAHIKEIETKTSAATK